MVGIGIKVSAEPNHIESELNAVLRPNILDPFPPCNISGPTAEGRGTFDL